MDLQLNLKTSVGKKPKQKNKDKFTNADKSDYSFVAKPVMGGKTIAKMRNKPTESTKTSNFTFIKTHSETNKDRNQQKESKPTKDKNSKTKNEDEINNEFPDLSMNIKNVPIKNKHKKEKKHDHNNESGGTKTRNESGKPEVRKRSVLSHISSLFRNNPDVPRLGQRLVKPISEKVFSGRNFEDLEVHSYSIANLEKNMGLKQLTVVQQKACPVILNGRDVLVRSQTGSGKTLAYGLPIVEALQAIRPKLKRQDGVKALIIVPTRELAIQTYELFIKLVRPFTWIVPGYLIGGEKRKAEKARIRKGFNILIGTPGRLCDHLEHTASLSLGKTRCLILDEADRLLDMGYEKDVSSIVDCLKKHQAADRYDPMAMVRESVKQNHLHFDEDDRQEDAEAADESKAKDEVATEYKHHLSDVFMSDKRQTVLLSATLTKAVETLAGLTMEDPVFIDASEGRATLIADSLATQQKPTPIPKVTEEVSTSKNEGSDVSDNEDAGFEIVPQEGEEKVESDDEGSVESEIDAEESEDEENESESADDDDSESNDSESGDDNSEPDDGVSSEEEIDKSKLKLYKGLAAFGGFKEEKEDKTRKKKDKKSKTKQKNKKEVVRATDGGSDSDSDYDFFAVAKVDIKEAKREKKSKKEAKTTTDDEKSTTETNFLTQSGEFNNPFQNALKTAITEDEMIIPSSVTQLYILTPMKLRLITLSALIIERCVQPGKGKMLIFMATQDMIDYHCELLSRALAGRKPHHIYVEDNLHSTRNKKSVKNVESSTNEDAVKPDDDSNVSPSKTDSTKVQSDDDYEYNFDSMDLADYEAKMRAEKAFVNVDFFQLHGSMNQKTRTEVFNTFRKATSGVLLCTTRPLPVPQSSRQSPRVAKESFVDKLTKYKKARKKQDGAATTDSKQATNHLSTFRHRYFNKISTRLGNKSKRLRHNAQFKVSDGYCLDCFKVDDTTDVNTNSDVVNAFRRAKNPSVLFCTDVAARGLDLPHVDCIVQYTGPISATDYVHRVGRTARAGNVGMAVMILLPSEVDFVRQLEKRRIRLMQEDMEVSHRALLKDSDTKTRQIKGGGPSPVQLAAAQLQQSYEDMVKGDKGLYIKACKAFTSWLRFYSTYPREARVAFDRKALHIGHAATALALTDTPKKIGKEAPKPVNRKDSDLKRRAEKDKHIPKMKTPSAKDAKREKRMLVSEFESGLEPTKKKPKLI